MFNTSYDGRLWQLVEWWYRYPEAPPRRRDPKKPLQIIAVGFSRSGTESLQTALIKLGYPTYHGWDILFEEDVQAQKWVALAKKKWYSKTGDCQITAEEFDKVIGHCTAVVDVPASCFAVELIEAYPEAKVICNRRRDWAKWQASSNKNIVSTGENRFLWFLNWFDAEYFWKWSVFYRFLHVRLGRSKDGSTVSGYQSQGIWVFKETLYTVKGLLWTRGEQHRLLDWYLEDGWEPLCKFLGKPVPDEPFPRTNDAAGFEGRVDAIVKAIGIRAMRNLALLLIGLLLTIGSVWWLRRH
jgi:hypothetical protein